MRPILCNSRSLRSLITSSCYLCPKTPTKRVFRQASTIPSSSSTKQGHSFHKRPLPANLIALSSKEGKQLFREALEDGYMESYFPLAEQFITQSEPSYCSISSLAMVLNALNFDLKRIWKGSWRWVSEEMLYCETKAVCGHSEEKIKQQGLDFHEFESLARCHGVKLKAIRACHPSEKSCSGISQFIATIEEICNRNKNDQFVVVNFSRKYLGQTGDGHYSPIAAYHKSKGYLLILDVARFKYPPYWVKVEELWDSMAVMDKATNQARGYFIVSGWEQDAIVRDDSKLVTTSAVATAVDVLTSVAASTVTCPPTIRTWELAENTTSNACSIHHHGDGCDHHKKQIH